MTELHKARPHVDIELDADLVTKIQAGEFSETTAILVQVARDSRHDDIGAAIWQGQLSDEKAVAVLLLKQLKKSKACPPDDEDDAIHIVGRR